jgi:hypothetical protein
MRLIAHTLATSILLIYFSVGNGFTANSGVCKNRRFLVRNTAFITCRSGHPYPELSQPDKSIPRTRLRKNLTEISSIRSNIVLRSIKNSELENDDDDVNAVNVDLAELRRQLVDPNDYAVTDSLDLLPSSRPTLVQALSNPRDIFISLPLIGAGLVVSGFNIFGMYNALYANIELVAVVLGIASALAYLVQLITGYGLSPNVRRGVIDESLLMVYTGAYTAGTSWLAIRASVFCPPSLQALDPLIGLAGVFIFVFSLIAPIITLLGVEEKVKVKENVKVDIISSNPFDKLVYFARRLRRVGDGGEKEVLVEKTRMRSPELSATEIVRSQGMVAIGVVGCLFAPDALSFALGGQEWWGRVSDLHPSQRMLESSTALFGLFATEASMLGHRVAKTGCVTYRDGCVPFGVATCFVLAVVPCVASLYWLGNDVSFFSFYTD